MGWAALILASFVAPRSWKDRPRSAEATLRRERWRAWSFGDEAGRAGFRRHLLDQNPFYWLAARARHKPLRVWAALLVIAVAWTWGLVKFGREWLNTVVFVTTGLALNFLLKVWFTTETTRQLAEDRKAGTLELLLTTPLSIRQIVRGQSFALQREFLAPLGAILAVESIFMLGPINEPMGEHERVLWVLLWLAFMVMLVADLFALFWLALWHALTARNQNHAAGASLTRILLLPYLPFALVLLCIALLAMSSRVEPDLGPGFFIGLWFFLGIAADLYFGAFARQKLLSQFRTAATQRFVKK
jgi:hypothetical protein